MDNIYGRIFNIQKFSVHDGPNIRDTVFMKGCPLQCAWCSNPESQSYALQVAYRKERCIGCGLCVAQCPQQALSLDEERHVIRDEQRCTNCGHCASVCCAQAMHVFGEDCTVEEVFARTQNQPTCWRTNGGVTISGGEPLLQADFVSRLLQLYQTKGVHTALESSFFASWEKVESVARFCDLVFCDMKLFDEAKHRHYTGVSNEVIKKNILRFRQVFPDTPFIVRTPVIPGVNDSPEELHAIVDFLKAIPGLTDYELLAFHAFGAAKYRQLGRTYAMENLSRQDKAQLLRLNNELRVVLGLPEQDDEGQ